jgi:hypothetical protein
MKNELIKISYDGENGTSDIRTLHDEEGILHISLRDIIRTLNQENREYDERHVSKSMVSIIKAQLQALDVDEYKMVSVEDRAGLSFVKCVNQRKAQI